MTSEQRKPTTTAADWQQRYVEANTPWDTNLVDRELRRAVESAPLVPCAAIEFGCGTGTNAVYLAQKGFHVTAVDFAPLAVEQAEARAAKAGAAVRFLTGDVTKLDNLGQFDFVFDRGCYHCVRRAGAVDGYLATVARLTRSGARLLILAGNCDDSLEGGPPKVRAAELLGDFEPICRLEHLVPFRFQEADGRDGWLGWRCSFVRR
jgi:SAM-dependent methyltransferase